MQGTIGNLSAGQVVKMFDLAPHPEGGFYRETFRDGEGSDGRSISTAIFYLMQDQVVSRWHRIDSAEIWHWYGGGRIDLEYVAPDTNQVKKERLGGRLTDNETPQVIVPSNAWQRARACGEWTLAGCTVAPGFEFEKFEMAEADWHPV